MNYENYKRKKIEEHLEQERGLPFTQKTCPNCNEPQLECRCDFKLEDLEDRKNW